METYRDFYQPEEVVTFAYQIARDVLGEWGEYFSRMTPKDEIGQPKPSSPDRVFVSLAGIAYDAALRVPKPTLAETPVPHFLDDVVRSAHRGREAADPRALRFLAAYWGAVEALGEYVHPEVYAGADFSPPANPYVVGRTA